MNGYWEPHSASIDFCETNYQLNSNIAEIHNTWSSILGITLFGILGLFYGNPTHELRYFLSYLLLILIGIGSAGLHTTLHWKLQSSDELPMLYLILLILYLTLEYDSPIISNNNKARTTLNYPYLPVTMCLIAFMNTMIYFIFQSLYIVFFGTYSFGVILGLYRLYQIWNKPSTSMQVKYISKLMIVFYLMIATPFWFLDMFYCSSINISSIEDRFILKYANGMTFHVIWHFAAGFASYCAVLALACGRMEVNDQPVIVKYVGGIIPIITNSLYDTHTDCTTKKE